MQESSERVRAEGGEWGPGSGPMSQLGAEVTGPAMIQLREVPWWEKGGSFSRHTEGSVVNAGSQSQPLQRWLATLAM